MQMNYIIFVFILGTLTPGYGLRESKEIPGENVSDSSDTKGGKLSKYMKSVMGKVTYVLVRKNWKLGNHLEEEETKEFHGKWEDAYKYMLEEYYPYHERSIEKAEELFTAKNENLDVDFDSNLESIIIFHPLNGNLNCNFIRAAVTAMRLRNLQKKYNLFTADMSKINLYLYYKIFKQKTGLNVNYEELSEILSMLIIKGIEHGHWKPNNIHLIGFSVSANLVGYMARYIKLIYNEMIGSILALDPYNNGNTHYIHPSSDDASVVHIYHSCSYVSGTRERIATADFVFNGAYIQPECKNRLRHPEPYGCSHKKIALRFWYIILFPKMFMARKCGTWQRFKNCFCEQNEEVMITYPIEKNPARGIYQIRTTGTKPYGLGEAGSKCSPEKKNKFNEKRNLYIRRAKFGDKGQ